MDEQIYELEINLLEPNPLQPRGLIAPESLSELAESIRAHGILEPLVVAPPACARKTTPLMSPFA